MTGQTMIDRCEVRFRDTSNAIVAETSWLAYLNAAYRQFLRQSKWPAMVTETTAVIAANGRSVDLSDTAVQGGIVSVLLASGYPLEKQPADLDIKLINHWTTRPTSPLYYELRGGRISVLPAWAAGGTLTVGYLAAPTALAVGTSPIFPETYHDALIAGALAQAYRDDGNAELAAQYQAEFDAMAAAADESGEER
jgi:hypothetical protein